ncbi:hypothetical protein C7M84_024304 [Penaeus vannamei]|uniref:WAP domain-containing protein n=1 Tax=Penaeus vannamei TaxID=6689 RepID=A0A423U1G7_PENVA|nr:uncharacterized protein LOC113800689 [Penaeus vannamei]ROT82531.1 hypothetical protein C7M84_024304 [Penaeus vannamei]
MLAKESSEPHFTVMSSTAVRVCALLLLVLMLENSWAMGPFPGLQKKGFCPLLLSAPIDSDSLGFERTGCRGDYECEDDLKCCPGGACCHFSCMKPLDRLTFG